MLPALCRQYDVAFWSASTEVTSRGAISLPAGVPALALDRTSADPLHSLRAWRPDLLFAHGLDDAEVESRVLDLAPAVIVEHTYHGTCISSAKTMSWPVVQACDRRFGPACLALYFPRRCGGLNPVTMVTLYRTQSKRRAALRRAEAVITLSEHMAVEVRRHGVDAGRVHAVPPFVTTNAVERHPDRDDDACRLLYLGRLERLKGVDRLLDAIGTVARRLSRPVHLVVAGDGADRRVLEQQAVRARREEPRVSVAFAGWQDATGRAALLARADALVVPSLWPEPFGLVGLEAAAAGVPSVAFATGGIPEWLHDGENGCLAPAAGASPGRLAEAIIRCTEAPATHARLKTGARESAARWSLERHAAGLDHVFRLALGRLVSRAS